MMYTMDLCENEQKMLQKLMSDMTEWEPEGTKHIQYLSHLPELSFHIRRERSSPVGMYWERDRCWSAFYGRLFHLLVKLNFFYRINILLDETLIFDVTPDTLERELKETVSLGKTPISLFLERYENTFEEPFDEEEIGSKVLGLITVGGTYDGLFDDDAVFYSNDHEMNELFQMLASSEGLFTTALS